jgi:foldase protein PrsA
VSWLASFAVAATVAGQSVTDAQVAHWQRSAGSRDAAFEFLVRAEWTIGEAKERHVVVTDAQARRAVDTQPTDGLTKTDLAYEAKLELLTAGIKEQITTPAAQSVTPEQVDAYITEHPRMRPERRRMHILQAAGRHEAAVAERKIAHGLTWRTAAKRYGINGGARQRTVWPGDYDRDVEERLFKAETNRLTRYRTFVFKVTSVLQPRPAPVQEQRAAAYEVLASEAEQRALDAFTDTYTQKWRARTSCARAYATRPVCGQGPSGQTSH